jgi:hypothetical protein
MAPPGSALTANASCAHEPRTVPAQVSRSAIAHIAYCGEIQYYAANLNYLSTLQRYLKLWSNLQKFTMKAR